MAINAIDHMKPNGVASLACDDVSDVADLPTYAQDHGTALGSSCIVVDTGDVYMQKTDKTWKKL